MNPLQKEHKTLKDVIGSRKGKGERRAVEGLGEHKNTCKICYRGNRTEIKGGGRELS